MADYIPGKETDKIAWLLTFGRWLTDDDGANALAHGFTWEQACGFYASAFQASLALMNARKTQGLARAATIHKNQTIGEAVALARDYVGKLQHDLTMTDAERAAAGITVSDTTKTAATPDAIAMIPPPLLVLDFSIRHQVSVHWGPNPGNEHQNAKPAGVLGCEIQYAQGGLPQEESGWTTLGLDTDSPMIHHVENRDVEYRDRPALVPRLGQSLYSTTYVYRARYVDKHLHYGNFSAPAECTVSV